MNDQHGAGIGSDPHEHDVPEPRPWGVAHSVPEGYEVKSETPAPDDRKEFS